MPRALPVDLPAQNARLGLMLLSVAFWSLWGFDAFVWLCGEIATFGEAWVPSSAGVWIPWWDMEHPASGSYMAIMLSAAILLLAVHMRKAGVVQAALPVGQLDRALMGSVLAVVLFGRFAAEAVAGFATSAGSSDAILEEREGFDYVLTFGHLPGEFLWSVITAPVFEEMTFRGLLLGCLLARGWNPWVAVTIAAAAFAATHDQYQLPALVSVFAGGLALGWLRIVSKGLLAPILAHSIANGWIFIDDLMTLAHA